MALVWRPSWMPVKASRVRAAFMFILIQAKASKVGSSRDQGRGDEGQQMILSLD